MTTGTKNIEGYTYIRTDKNGTEYYQTTKCTKCGGEGYLRGYEHVEGGVCFLCMGTGQGKVRTIKYMTPEYAQKLADRRLEKRRKQAPEINAKICTDLGLNSDGTTWCAVGNTYAIKEQLKEAGAKYNDVLGWHFSEEPKEFNTVQIYIGAVCENSMDERTGIWMISGFELENYVKERKEQYEAELRAQESTSEYLGEIGEKVEATVTLQHYFGFENKFGGYYDNVSYKYIFKNTSGNEITWTTSKYLEEVIENKEAAVTICGTIKAQSEYKGVKQTVLTRCKIK